MHLCFPSNEFFYFTAIGAKVHNYCFFYKCNSIFTNTHYPRATKVQKIFIYTLSVIEEKKIVLLQICNYYVTANS